MANNAITTGSLSAIAQQNNTTLAESFLSCDVLLLADMSGSMATIDARGGKSRYDVAEADIIRLQEKYQGKVALVVFSSTVQFCPGGVPIRLHGLTDLAAGLRFINPVDDCDIKIIVISDGEPNDEREALKVARTFKSAIQTIYIGPETDDYGGRAFLEKLANITGGQHITSESPGLLADNVEKLMLTTG